eukprot:XP_008671516.1 aspartic proteinase nepenthesin-1 [Zea mays]
MTFSVGTPPQKLSALADTGSDLIWVKCGACKRCAPQGALLPTTLTASAPPFSTLRCSSNLCNDLPAHQYSAAAGAECSYKYSYGLASIVLGCTNMSEGGYGSGSGLVGLGRGLLSLVSQLEVSAISYCLDHHAVIPQRQVLSFSAPAPAVPSRRRSFRHPPTTA